MISVNVQSFFGGVDDKREFKPQAGNSRLIIRGSNAFAGLEIKTAYEEPEEVYYVTLKNGQSLRASASGYQILKERLGI